MKNRIAVEIAGKEFVLIADESEEYYRALVAELNARIDDLLYRHIRTSRSDTALLVALDLLDENKKLTEANDNLRQQLSDYLEEMNALNRRLISLEKKPKPQARPAAAVEEK